MFRIKICGITSEDDAKAAVEAGADALGLNFYPKSPRYITQETAARIVRAIPSNIVKVGLFVNEAVDLVTTTFDGLGLDLIQLHGDEPPEYLAQLDDRPVMKAFRMKSNGIKAIEDYVCRTGFQPVTGEGNSQPVGNLSCVLIDSYMEGVYGGSGAKADWGGCAAFARNVKNPPLVLAGGLCPENVAKAIETVRPAAVDTASGVESSSGHKDRRLMALFVENARRGFLSKDG